PQHGRARSKCNNLQSWTPMICRISKLKYLPLALVAAATLATSLVPTVQAQTYYVVVPAHGKSSPDAAIRLNLGTAALPEGWVGVQYEGFDFNSLLLITGDPTLEPALTQWRLDSGQLPEGLTL